MDAPGNRFVYSLWDAGEIRIADLSDPANPNVRKFKNIGKQPYDALITPDGRYYIAGLFGEDGLALLDLWQPDQGVRRILPDYGRDDGKMPVYKMPHLVSATAMFIIRFDGRGWSERCRKAGARRDAWR